MNPGQEGRAGLEVRRLAAGVLDRVLVGGVTVDAALSEQDLSTALEPRDRGFLQTIILTSLRRRGEIEAILGRFLTKPLPRKSGLASAILFAGVAQLLFLQTSAHAAIDLSVQLAREDRNARHFSGLINAVLRKVSAAGPAALAEMDSVRLNTPQWLWQRWSRAYGEDAAAAIAAANQSEPSIDIVAGNDPAGWALRLGGVLLPTGHIRLPAHAGTIDALPGFMDGAWWVQDAAAGIPVRLLGNVSGMTVLDLCAAPGGKTMQLCASGAVVTAVDRSPSRLVRLKQNLRRTNLKASVLQADVLSVGELGEFDAVLLDAPCSATGTIRRHPELPYQKSEKQIHQLAHIERQMLEASSKHVRLGGTLLYCTCSLEPEEGEKQIDGFLSKHADFELDPVSPSSALPAAFVTARGWIRILPHMTIGTEDGLDGFFAAVIRRQV